DTGPVPPVTKLVAAPKEPVPVPSRIDMSLELPFATARSWLPSPLKFPTARVSGLAPAAKLVGAPKEPVPVPSKIDMLLEALFAAARSFMPSPLKSPTATDQGVVPAP